MAPLPAASSAQVRGHGGGAGAVETRGAGWGRRRGGDGGGRAAAVETPGLGAQLWWRRALARRRASREHFIHVE